LVGRDAAGPSGEIGIDEDIGDQCCRSADAGPSSSHRQETSQERFTGNMSSGSSVLFQL